MQKIIMAIDVEKCNGCYNCFLACKDEFLDNDWPPFSAPQPKHEAKWLNLLVKERGQCPMVDVAYMPMPCMQCDEAPCIRRADNQAVYKRPDGIVVIDPLKSKGQKNLIETCPYGAIWWNDDLQLPQKCTFCVHLLENGWSKPRCAQACPTEAIQFFKGEEDQLQKLVGSMDLAVLHPEYETCPRVYYRGLHRILQCFIGGSVAANRDGQVDCVEGVRVVLSRDSRKIAETVSDNFGDFKFEFLNENSGEYVIELNHPQYEKRILNVDLKTSVYVGSIELSPA